MKTIIQLAFRNVGRNRRRSILALISVSLSLTMIVCLQGWIGGMMKSVVKNYTKNETGHIRIATVNFEEKAKFFTVTSNIKAPWNIIDSINTDPLMEEEIALITSRINFGVLLNNDGKNVSAFAFSGNPETEKRLLMLHESILEGGRYIQGPKETIIGHTLAQRLGFKVGDTLKIVASGSDYALRMKKVIIVGIYKTGLNLFDENVFQLPIESARELLGMETQTQQIIIMLKDWRKSEQIASHIRKMIPDTAIAVTPWTQIGDYYRLVQMSESTYTFIYIVVAFLGTFIISNIMMMIVMERRKEIGILKSMGMTKRDVLVLFLTEGIILGVTGSIIGTFTGWAIVTLLGHTGIDITSMMQSLKFPIDNIIYPQISFAGILGSLLLGTLASAFVSLIPSRQAASMNAVDAIKSV